MGMRKKKRKKRRRRKKKKSKEFFLLPDILTTIIRTSSHFTTHPHSHYQTNVVFHQHCEDQCTLEALSRDYHVLDHVTAGSEVTQARMTRMSSSKKLQTFQP